MKTLNLDFFFIGLVIMSIIDLVLFTLCNTVEGWDEVSPYKSTHNTLWPAAFLPLSDACLRRESPEATVSLGQR